MRVCVIGHTACCSFTVSFVPRSIPTDLFLQRMFTKFNEITQCNGHYAVQGHSMSPIFVPIAIDFEYDFLLVINTNFYLLYLAPRSKLWLIIAHIFASERGVPHFNALAGGDPLPISP